MAFDAGMLAAQVNELNTFAAGARVEKIYQPSKDEILIQLHVRSGSGKLLINAGSNTPRIGFTYTQRENPASAPMFCMLLRKHIGSAKFVSAVQQGFERVAVLEFDTHDEMGYSRKEYLIAEIMGKFSNLILAGPDMKIIAPLKTVDFTTSSLRQVLPGMIYSLPPKQDKLNPLEVDGKCFADEFSAAPTGMAADKFISGRFLGLSSATAREIVYGATRHTDTPLCYCDAGELYSYFSKVAELIRDNRFTPCLMRRTDGTPFEYSFFPLEQYGASANTCIQKDFGELLDIFFEERDREQTIRQKASDILRILTNADTRIRKKLELQTAELADCERGEEYRKEGDLITSNLYRIGRGAKSVMLTDYSMCDADGKYPEISVELDPRLSPAANAQRLFKKYAKCKTAKSELTKQTAAGRAELRYIETVFESLTKAESSADLAEIRDELFRSGYASKMKDYVRKKAPKPTVMKFVTDGGYTLLCGKNNLQNEYVSFTLASKTDYWFHVKDFPGSHVVMICNGEEPDSWDFTQAAEVAAYYSKAEGDNIAVDYTLVKNLKRPPASKPGFVIYHSNWTAYVSPDKKGNGPAVKRMG